jgi:hypothetical protein
MRPVESSAVAAIAYDARCADVYVEFVDGDTYAYGRVPPPIWHAFETAPSKGRFVNLVLKPHFACRKL